MKVYKLTIDGIFLADASLDGLIETMKIEFAENECEEATITVEEMTEEEYSSLPEFDGF